jgi:hypothetical protein
MLVPEDYNERMFEKEAVREAYLYLNPESVLRKNSS